MNSDKIPIAVSERLISGSEALSTALRTLRQQWLPESPPPYIEMAKIAETLVQKKPIDLEAVRRVLTCAEEIIQQGGSDAELVTVGFLEALLSQASSGKFDLSEIVQLFGPGMLEYWDAWDRFTGCTLLAKAKEKSDKP